MEHKLRSKLVKHTLTYRLDGERMTKMAYIKKIKFDKAGKNEGCLCDRCGQYIQNIWTVEFSGGLTVHFGVDCFEQMRKKKLTNIGEQQFKKVMKAIERLKEWREKQEALTEETDTAYQYIQQNQEDYWCGKPWSEYHEWMLTKFYEAREADCQKAIDRFGKVDFKL